MDKKNIIITSIAFICLLIIIFFLFRRYSTATVEYIGFGDSLTNPFIDVKKDIVITDDFANSDKIEFIQRKITGGGSNPGWVISLLETQPKIFTGRVIVDDGVYQYPVTLKEEVDNVFVGQMKGVNGKKEIFSMKKQNSSCTDEDKNIFEYSLSGAYGATQFSGCGGEALKVVE